MATMREVGVINGEISFEQLCGKEPRLGQLYQKARAISDDNSNPHFCANEHWCGYGEGKRMLGGLREALDDLAGFFAENPKLRTLEAHDLARRTLFGALPNCRNCSCVRMTDVMHRRRPSQRRSRPAGSNRRNRGVAGGARK
jgi:hypothetical protein